MTDDTFVPVVKTYVRHGGYNLIPVRTDGTRWPLVRWKPYQTDRFPFNQLVKYITGQYPCGRAGVMAVCGITSGNVEVIDHDGGEDVYRKWVGLVRDAAPDLLDVLPTVRSPGKGYGIWYRTDRPYHDPKPLARVKGNDGIVRPLVELLGQGSMATLPTPPPYVHRSGRPHVLLTGNILSPPILSGEQRVVLLTAARSLNQYTPPRDDDHEVRDDDLIRQLYGEWDVPADRPGDRYNREADWADILEPAGWDCVRRAGRVGYWRKPMSRGPEHHATTDYYPGKMIVFTTGAAPLEYQKAYTKFGVYTLLNHGGDYHAAANELARRGDHSQRAD